MLTAPVDIRQWIPVSQLILHPTVQRHRHSERPLQRERQIQYLVAHWDWKRCSDLRVMPADPAREPRAGIERVYWVICGGHRTETAVRLNLPTLPCRVEPPTTTDIEALEIAEGEERRIDWTPYGDFVTAAEMGRDPEATIKAIVEHEGAHIGRDDFGYSCTDKLRRIFDLGVLQPTVAILQAAWPTAPMGRHQNIVVAISRFHRYYQNSDNYDPSHFAVKLSRRSAADLIVGARSRGLTLRVGVVDCLLEDLLAIYNKGRPQKSRLPLLSSRRRRA